MGYVMTNQQRADDLYYDHGDAYLMQQHSEAVRIMRLHFGSPIHRQPVINRFVEGEAERTITECVYLQYSKERVYERMEQEKLDPFTDSLVEDLVTRGSVVAVCAEIMFAIEYELLDPLDFNAVY